MILSTVKLSVQVGGERALRLSLSNKLCLEMDLVVVDKISEL